MSSISSIIESMKPSMPYGPTASELEFIVRDVSPPKSAVNASRNASTESRNYVLYVEMCILEDDARLTREDPVSPRDSRR